MEELKALDRAVETTNLAAKRLHEANNVVETFRREYELALEAESLATKAAIAALKAKGE